MVFNVERDRRIGICGGAQVASDKGEIGGFDGDIAAGAHGQT